MLSLLLQGSIFQLLPYLNRTPRQLLPKSPAQLLRDTHHGQAGSDHSPLCCDLENPQHWTSPGAEVCRLIRGSTRLRHQEQELKEQCAWRGQIFAQSTAILAIQILPVPGPFLWMTNELDTFQWGFEREGDCSRLLLEPASPSTHKVLGTITFLQGTALLLLRTVGMRNKGGFATHL